MINLWRVAAYTLTALAICGTIMALLMEKDLASWAALSVSGAVFARIEWVLAAMVASTKGDSAYEP